MVSRKYFFCQSGHVSWPLHFSWWGQEATSAKQRHFSSNTTACKNNMPNRISTACFIKHSSHNVFFALCRIHGKYLFPFNFNMCRNSHVTEYLVQSRTALVLFDAVEAVPTVMSTVMTSMYPGIRVSAKMLCKFCHAPSTSSQEDFNGPSSHLANVEF